MTLLTGALTLSGFLHEIRDRFIDRAGLDPDAALATAVAALETWDDAEEPVELTVACAHAIADTDLEHWEDS